MASAAEQSVRSGWAASTSKESGWNTSTVVSTASELIDNWATKTETNPPPAVLGWQAMTSKEAATKQPVASGWTAVTTTEGFIDSGVTYVAKRTPVELEVLQAEYMPTQGYGNAEVMPAKAKMTYDQKMAYEKKMADKEKMISQEKKMAYKKKMAGKEKMAGKYAEKKSSDRKWYSWFWPLGDKVKVKALKDEYVPFKTEKDVAISREEVLNPQKSGDHKKPKFQPGLLPDRPKLAIERGNGFLSRGNLNAGYVVPGLGWVLQPRLWAYFINRTAFQSFDNGISGNERETEIANRLDVFFNLQLTGTEKILLGLRPTDNNRPGAFTRYTFEGQDEGFNENFGFNVETLFFEGDLGSIFQNWDLKGTKPIDLGFTVGRQPVVFQEGILINDTIDAVGLIRNNIPVSGTSNFRVSAMWGWNRLDRNDFNRPDGREPGQEHMFGLFIAADAKVSTFNLDMIYVTDEDNGGGFYIGASAIQRIASLDNISTAFRINSSFALEDEISGNVIGDGTLITAEISKTPKGSDDIVYFNSFLGIGNYTQAGREAVVGGPLANTGILFASPNLSTYGAEIDPFTSDSVIGGAIGYQAFWDNKRRNLILEIAGRHDLSGDGIDSLGFGAQLQQAVGQHVQLTFEAFYTINEDTDDGAGGRAEIQVVY
ncbi:MAG: hypothetical protein ACR2OX_08625 [Methyloligellaceae bacterium]